MMSIFSCATIHQKHQRTSTEVDSQPTFQKSVDEHIPNAILHTHKKTLIIVLKVNFLGTNRYWDKCFARCSCLHRHQSQAVDMHTLWVSGQDSIIVVDKDWVASAHRHRSLTKTEPQHVSHFNERLYFAESYDMHRRTQEGCRCRYSLPVTIHNKQANVSQESRNHYCEQKPLELQFKIVGREAKKYWIKLHAMHAIKLDTVLTFSPTFLCSGLKDIWGKPSS